MVSTLQAAIEVLRSPALASLQTYSSVVLTDGPVRYYRLGETSGSTAVDSSPNSLNGTYDATALVNQPGLLVGDADRAVSAGASTAVSATATGLPSAAAPRTLETWFKSTTSTVWSSLMSYGDVQVLLGDTSFRVTNP
ncbi:MAG TPA: hypothetical protein VFJ85_08550, partial [Acidimicrobiales bacterium]|nr:hypothetical protein [Acidimicrobiales bacterium]